MPAEVVLAALRQAWTALQALHVPLALMGGLAMGAWKRPRFTKDVDLLIAIGEPMARTALKHLRSAGFRTRRADPIVRIQETRFIQFFYETPDTLMEVQFDLLLATTDFHRQAWSGESHSPRPNSASISTW